MPFYFLKSQFAGFIIKYQPIVFLPNYIRY